MNAENLIRCLLLTCAALAFASCASKEPPPLIADPAARGETALPWNEQKTWEREGQMAGLTQNRR